jgi:hypothetical protein
MGDVHDILLRSSRFFSMKPLTTVIPPIPQGTRNASLKAFIYASRASCCKGAGRELIALMSKLIALIFSAAFSTPPSFSKVPV